MVNGLVPPASAGMVEPMSLAKSRIPAAILALVRHDWTRAEVARAVRAAVSRTAVPGRAASTGAFRSGRGADLDAAVDQDRRLPGGLRLLPAGGALRHRRQGREADGARRRAGRGARGQGRRRHALLHGRGLARAEGPRSRQRLRHGRGRQGARAGNLRHARHADADAGRPPQETPASTTTTTTSTPRRSTTARSSPPAPTRTGSTRWPRCAPPASMSAAAASSAWAKARTTAPACSRRSPACRCIRKACRSTCWCRSRARRSAGERKLDPLDFVRTIAVARIMHAEVGGAPFAPAART